MYTFQIHYSTFQKPYILLTYITIPILCSNILPYMLKLTKNLSIPHLFVLSLYYFSELSWCFIILPKCLALAGYISTKKSHSKWGHHWNLVPPPQLWHYTIIKPFIKNHFLIFFMDSNTCVAASPLRIINLESFKILYIQ
jgi:hypothetical protein